MKSSQTFRHSVLNSAYKHLFGKDVDLNHLANELFLDCGVDGQGLSSQDFVDAFNDEGSIRWADIQYACTAALATYSACGCSNIEFIRSIAGMIIISNSVRRGFGDWERSFDFMMTILSVNKLKCDFPIRAEVLKIALCDCPTH